jgi:hypothetical protein
MISIKTISPLSLLMLAVASLAITACDNRPAAEGDWADAEPKVYSEGPVEFSLISPNWAADTSWLDMRAEQQENAISGSQVFHDFSLTDNNVESGIDFKYNVVNDASVSYKGVHYDHGSGVAVADVDGDGYSDIYFPNQVGENGLWLNNGDGTFTDATAASGVGIADRISVGAAFADVDNDGDVDLFVTTVKGGNVLFENDGSGNFKDISALAGVGHVGHSSGAVFFDYDNDGLLDLYVTNIGMYTSDEIGSDGAYVGFEDAFEGHTKPERTEGSILYHNLGENKFADVTVEMGIENDRWSGDATPIDANNDGWVDLYVLSMQGLDGYYENQAGEGFVDKTAEVFPRSSWGAMGVQVFDFDNDGDQDIFVTDMHSDMAEQVLPILSEEKRKADMVRNESFHQDGGNAIWGNSFFRNEGDGSFTEVSDEVNAENFWPWGLSAGDLNADGAQDVFIASSMNYPWRYGINSVLLNNGSSFVDAEFALGVEPKAGPKFVPWFEIDCAGADQGHRDCPKQFSAGNVVVNGSTGSRSSVIFDYDNDGDLDVITSEFGTEPLVLQSNLADVKKVNSIRVDLTGTQSNRGGLGSTVTVNAGGSTYTQVMDGRSGYLGQSDLPLYFGLGDAQSIDSITVSWPSGAEQDIAGPIAANNQVLEVIEAG